MATDPLLSTGEAAKLLNVSDETLRRWTKEGRVRHVRMPSGRSRYHHSDVLALLSVTEPSVESA